VKFKHLDALS